MRPPLRLAILECDTPLARTHATYGGYGGVFTALLRAGAAQTPVDADTSLSISCWQIERHPDAYPDPAALDAILITGSRHTSFDDDPWITTLVAFVRRLLATDGRVRVIGVCFGHQIVARALGSPLGRSAAGWEVSVLPMALSPLGQRIFFGDDPKKEGGRGINDSDGHTLLRLHQMHRDEVLEMPAGTHSLGSSPKCAVQGFYLPRRLLTLQGHPEFNAEIVEEILESRHRQAIFDDQTYQEALNRVRAEQDGVLVAKAFLSFLLED